MLLQVEQIRYSMQEWPPPPMNITDGELVERAQAGDAQAWAHLYDRYVRDIYAFTFWRLHEKEVAEDTTSDIFIKAMLALPRFKSEKGTFKAWLYMIARNTVIDVVRAKKPSVELEEAVHLEHEPKGQHRLSETIDASRVLPYLEQLREDQKEIVMLRVWNELSHKEIAQLLNISEAASKMAFSRSIKQLRSIMPPEVFAVLLATMLTPSL